MGGMMAWNMAGYDTLRVKKLVLLNSAGYEMQKIAKGAAGAMTSAPMELFFSKGMPLSFTTKGAVRCYADASRINYSQAAANNECWNREGNIHAAFAMASSGQFPDSNLITHVQCPTLDSLGGTG